MAEHLPDDHGAGVTGADDEDPFVLPPAFPADVPFEEEADQEAGGPPCNSNSMPSMRGCCGDAVAGRQEEGRRGGEKGEGGDGLAEAGRSRTPMLRQDCRRGRRELCNLDGQAEEDVEDFAPLVELGMEGRGATQCPHDAAAARVRSMRNFGTGLTVDSCFMNKTPDGDISTFLGPVAALKCRNF